MPATAPSNGQDDLDGGAASLAPGMARHCALNRALRPVDEMIRFVVGPGGEAVPDVKRKLPGRGIWITGTRAALEEAVKRNVFARGFKRDVQAAADLVATTERLLERGALDALAMAGKAGAVVVGFAKVEAAIDADADEAGLLALLHATDASPDGKRKLTQGLRRKTPEKSRQIALIEQFTGAQLDLALNRPNVVHAALLAGPGADTFLVRVRRLERFRTGHSPAEVCAIAPTDGARGQNTE